jgi:hypothetical protein
MRTISALTLAIILGSAAQAAVCQSLPAPPSGFQVDQQAAQMQAQMRAAGVADGVRGTKANDNMSPCFSDPKIIFGYGWNLNPAGKIVIDMMLKAPQDPASKSPQTGVLDEPVSKQAYKDGVLEWRKQIWPVITGHPCNDSQVVFYSGKWMGPAGNKIIGISVDRLYNSMGQGQAWIDEYIEKVKGALNSK